MKENKVNMSKKIKELSKKIIQARKDYYDGDPQVLDAVFDAWIDELKELDPKNKAITAIGSPVSEEWKTAEHKIPLGSLDKVNSPEEMLEWVEKKCGNDAVFLNQKFDGLSMELVYEEGQLTQCISRGDGTTGYEMSANVKKMNGVPYSIPNFTGSIRGEILLKKSNHQKYFADKANPRNAAVGISKRLDGVGAEHLDVFSYQIIGELNGASPWETEEDVFIQLKKFGCNVSDYKTFDEGSAKKNAEKIIKEWQAYQDTKRDKLDWDIDGLVIRLTNLEKQIAGGHKDFRPKLAVAFKFAAEMRESVVKDVKWQVGNNSRLTPVVYIEPVLISGAMIEKASLYNVAYIEKLGLDIGATVLVARANDVIPRVEEVIKSTGTVAKYPKTCPACSSKTEFDGENLMCSNKVDCPALTIGKVKNWISTLNILEWGDKIIERLCETGLVETIADLYRLSIEDLMTIERMGEKSSTKCYEILHSHNPIELELLLGGLSIPMIGTSSIKMIINEGYDTLEKIRNMTVDQLSSIPGLGPIKSQSLYEGLQDNEELIDDILDCGIKIKEKTMGKLNGMSFCFTGALSIKRAEAEQMVVEAGGEVKSSVGKGLTILVLADPESQSSKAVKARSLGTKLINEEQFLELLK